MIALAQGQRQRQAEARRLRASRYGIPGRYRRDREGEADGVILRAPGIGDDARGLAALLSVIQALNANAITTVGDVMLVGTVGEEELGNLRGVKALFRDHPTSTASSRSTASASPASSISATGSHRYEMIFSGPGGHSFQEFGLPSAIHAMGRAIAKIADLQTPAEPKTTFTVGTVRGGTSVNAIAGEAQHGGRHALELDRGAAEARSAAARARQARPWRKKTRAGAPTRSPSRSS